MKCFYITLIIFSLNASQASIYSNLKDNVLSLLQRRNSDPENDVLPPHSSPQMSRYAIEPRAHPMRTFHHKRNEDAKDAKAAKHKANVLKKVRTHEENMNLGRDLPSNQLTESLNHKQIGREYYHMDPVLNELRRKYPETRRKRKDKSSKSTGESSSLEMKNWMDEWDEEWMQKKFEALNSSQHRGDVVNMVAARPWGVPCGDPNQHDMPWGSCTLPAECDGEYRIYRGDHFCGRTQYVCCALMLTNYDMYQALDVSFDDSSFSTDSNEKGAKGSKEGDRKKRKQERKRRKKDRAKRKRQIKKSIRQIIKEIRKILNRAFRNGTAQRKRKTKELKKFIEDLKKKYRKDRKAVINVHEYEMVRIDDDLQKRLDQIKDVNQAFMSNDTFRDIIVNGTVNKVKVLKLLRAHPELAKLFQGSLGAGRRSNTLDDRVETDKENVNVLEYDLEYGQLYY